MTLHELYRFAISFLYPNICPVCENVIEYDDDFCDRCRSKMTMFYDDFHIENSDAFVAYCYYEGKIRNAIRKYKIFTFFQILIYRLDERHPKTVGVGAICLQIISSTRFDLNYKGFHGRSKPLPYGLIMPLKVYIGVPPEILRVAPSCHPRAKRRISMGLARE
jgi:hypothetical protein